MSKCLSNKKASVFRFAAFLLHLLESPLVGLVGPRLNDPYTEEFEILQMMVAQHV